MGKIVDIDDVLDMVLANKDQYWEFFPPAPHASISDLRALLEDVPAIDPKHYKAQPATSGESVELKPGTYMLSGVDYIPSDCGTGVVITLDGVSYRADEDLYDGYRSYAGGFKMTNTKPTNTFPPQKVTLSYESKYDILALRSNGARVLEVGTDYSDDWYPCAIFHYWPENLPINQKENI